MTITFGNPVTYLIKDAAGLALEVGELNRDNGGAVRIWDSEGGDAQQWRFEPAGDGFYRIRNVFSGKLLDTALQGVENGTWVHQWEDTGADSQQWTMVPARGQGGGFKICNKKSGTFLDIIGNIEDAGGQVQIWEGRKGQFQRWKITELNGTPSKKAPRKRRKPAAKK